MSASECLVPSTEHQQPAEPRAQDIEAALEGGGLSGAATEVGRLLSLQKISRALAEARPLARTLPQVLGFLARHHWAVRSVVTLLQDGQLRIEASAGPQPTRAAVTGYAGDEISRRVLESGWPVVLPRSGSEPWAMRRAEGQRELVERELTYIAVPMILNRRPIGTLSVDMYFMQNRHYDRTVTFLSVVASMITQAIAGRRNAEPSLVKLKEENAALQSTLMDRRAPSKGPGASGSNIVAIGLSPARDRVATQGTPTSGTTGRTSLSDAVSAVEQNLIQDALMRAEGNRAEAARLLDTTERILNYKVRKLGIDYRRFKTLNAVPVDDTPAAS